MANYLEMISPSSNEFDEIVKLVEKSCPNECVISIERVVNPQLYDRYFNYKVKLGEACKETTLFHGTNNEALLKICYTGFKKSKNTRSAFGLGTYLASAFAYSKNYAGISKVDLGQKSNYKILLVCKLAYNKMTLGSYNRACPEEFDIQVDNTKKPSIYAVDNDEAIYPEFVVRFY